MRITRKIAERVELIDNGTDFGGKSYDDETLAEFMAVAGVPFGSSLKKVNEALANCGLHQYTTGEIYILSHIYR